MGNRRAQRARDRQRQRKYDRVTARIQERTFEGRDGQRRCRRHGKVTYRTEDVAHVALIEHARSPDVDPGLVVYHCEFTGGWHLGHPGGWKSLQRVMELRGGTG